jgi:hypothetical protein
VNQTLSILLSTSWTNSSVNILAIDKPADFPHLKYPWLWWNGVSRSIYSFGGETSYAVSNIVPPLSIWALVPDDNGGGTWSEIYGPSDNIFNSLTRPNGGSPAFTPNAGYCLGGYVSEWTSPQTIGLGGYLLVAGLVSFNFKDSSWSNISSAMYSLNGFSAWVETQFVPSYGKTGVLLMVGGDAPTSQNYNAGSALRTMTNITIYDTYTQQWYHQTATGDIPAPRLQFCIAGAQAADNSTYEM